MNSSNNMNYSNNMNSYKKEPFGNINVQNSIILSPNPNVELNNYVNSYNNAIALLDDPNQLNKASFDTYTHIQDKKIAELNNNLALLQQNIKQNNNVPIKSFKSMNSSQILNVEEYPNPSNNGQDVTYKGNGSNNYPNYLIYSNNGCVEYNKTNKEWKINSCDSNNPNQQFTTTQINNINQYNSPITNSMNQNRLLNDSSSTQFGFYVVNPNNINDQCLQLNNDGLSIMPCTMDSSQRFRPKYKSVLE